MDGRVQGRGLVYEAVAIGLLSLTLNLVGNGRISLWDRDEPRYAVCTREMRASGDWVHPTFNAEPRYHKPVLIYWLMLAGTALGGDNPFGARLVSALAGTGTVLLVWVWGQRAFGAKGGRIAALVLATAPIMVVESKLATTDATLTVLVVACQLALWELSQRSSRWMAGLFWSALGLAVLTKSPAGPVLIGASAVASWWWGGPTAFWRRLHWRWGLPLAAAIVVPWNVAIMVRSHGAYYGVAVGYHIIQRATSGIEQHGGFPGYYVVIGFLTFFPWSALVPAAFAAAWTRRREDPRAGFLTGWLIGPLVLLECVRTKLIHYYLPAIPAAALLVGWFVARVLDDPARSAIRDWKLGRFGCRAIGGVGATTAIGLALAAFVLPVSLKAPLLAVATVMMVLAVFARREFLAGRTERAVVGLIGLTALLLATTTGWLLPAAEPYRISAVVGRRLAALEAREGVRSVLCTFQFPGAVFSLGHPAPIVRSRAELVEEVGPGGRVLSALLPVEIAMLKRDPALTIEVLETLEGFNLDKGRRDTVHLALVRRDGVQVGDLPSATTRR